MLVFVIYSQFSKPPHSAHGTPLHLSNLIAFRGENLPLSHLSSLSLMALSLLHSLPVSAGSDTPFRITFPSHDVHPHVVTYTTTSHLELRTTPAHLPFYIASICAHYHHTLYRTILGTNAAHAPPSLPTWQHPHTSPLSSKRPHPKLWHLLCGARHRTQTSPSLQLPGTYLLTASRRLSSFIAHDGNAAGTSPPAAPLTARTSPIDAPSRLGRNRRRPQAMPTA